MVRHTQISNTTCYPGTIFVKNEPQRRGFKKEKKQSEDK